MTAAQLRQEQNGGALVLDTRAAEQFAALHARGALQLGLRGRFASWAAMLIHPAQRLLLVADDARRAAEARERLARVGLRRVMGYSLADEARWREVGIDLGSLPLMRCESTSRILTFDPSIQLVDARSRAEWLNGHLPKAISAPLLELPWQVPALPPFKRSFVYCREGYRATTAASLLLRHGIADVGVLIDGIEGWLRLGLPLQMPDGRREAASPV